MARIDDDAAQAGAMAAHVLGREWTTMSAPCSNGQHRYGVGTVLSTISGTPWAWATAAKAPKSTTFAARIADGFAKYRLGLAVDQAAHGVDIAIVGETRFDTETRQGMREQIVGAAVQGRGGDDVVADLRDRHQRVGDGRRTGGYRQRADPPSMAATRCSSTAVVGFDPGVDVTRHLQVEQIGAVLSVVERVGRGLIDGNGNALVVGSGV